MENQHAIEPKTSKRGCSWSVESEPVGVLLVVVMMMGKKSYSKLDADCQEFNCNEKSFYAQNMKRIYSAIHSLQQVETCRRMKIAIIAKVPPYLKQMLLAH